jgi:hypothetical protein
MMKIFYRTAERSSLRFASVSPLIMHRHLSESIFVGKNEINFSYSTNAKLFHRIRLCWVRSSYSVERIKKIFLVGNIFLG